MMEPATYREISSYQLPLFRSFDLQLLFAERMKKIETHLDHVDPEAGIADVIERVVWNAKTCALEIFPYKMKYSVQKSGFSQDTGRDCFEYVFSIPFQGDAELWMLTPECAGPELPEGEIHRLRVSTGILASTEAEARHCYKIWLSDLDRIISLQLSQIEAFEASLPGLVWDKLIDRRSLLLSVSARKCGALH